MREPNNEAKTTMTRSMTGFASDQTTTAAGELLWELRTVNHRYLEMQFKLPEGFRALEPALRDLVAGKLKRGKLDASLQFRATTQSRVQLEVNEDLAAVLIEHAEELSNRIAEPQALNPLDILRWPGVTTEAKLDTTQLYEPAQQLLAGALDALCDNRAREGGRIQTMLDERLQQISQLSGMVRSRMPEVLEGVRERILERARALETRVDDDRLEQELVLLAQKMDVAEELDRLDAHVAEARATFETTGAIGRKLDFLMQEFNREANTLGSKSGDPETTKAAVDLKVLIEQMREQVQNVE